MSDTPQLTRFFTRTDDIDLDAVMPALYDELRQLASAYLRRERANHTLQPTALVHEAYVRLIDQTEVPWSNAAHFRGIAAKVMRQVLVDHARKHSALKRGGDRLRITLGSGVMSEQADALDMLELDELLQQLSALHERKAQVVELLFFGGMTHAEAATILGIARKTVEADWYMARAWLTKELRKGDA